MSGLWRRVRARPLLGFVALQIAAIAVVGVVTAVRFHVFAAVDELAHVSYVQDVAEQGALPWEGRSYVSWQMEAIEQDTYPQRSSVDPRHYGLAGYSYEGFQPPLYYLAAVPAFAIPSNYRDKVIAVRLLDVVLLLAAVALLALLARAISLEHRLELLAAGLAVLLWPGIVVRAVTVSNAALELPLTIAFVLAVWHASTRRSPRLLLAAAALLGLCLLTAITLVFLALLLIVPAAAIARERGVRASAPWAAGALLVVLALLAPWVATNEARYGALTATAIAKALQAPVVNPHGAHFGLGSVLAWLGRFERPILPQEWWSQYGGLGVLLRVAPALLAAAALAPLARRPRLAVTRQAALLAAPLALGFLTLVAIVLAADWPSFLPRYVNPEFVLLAVFAGWAWLAAGARPRAVAAGAVLASALPAAVWVWMAGAFYFTNVGRALGIHA